MTKKTGDNRTTEQRRAEHALACVQRAARREEKWQGNYKSYVKALPAAILNNGLGQAAATELAAGKGDKDNAHTQLYLDLESWLCGEYGPYYSGGAGHEKRLMQSIINGDQELYIRAQVEAIAWLEWLKKFAVAYLKGEASD